MTESTQSQQAFPKSERSMPLGFTKSIVAYLDILGFTNKFEEEANRARLLMLLVKVSETFDGSYHKDGSRDAVSFRPEVICISDCIVISIPLDCQSQAECYQRTMTFFLALRTIIFKFFQEGLLIRGGIDVGELFHRNNNIAGMAYINAVRHEKYASYPKVILTATAHDFLRDCYYFSNSERDMMSHFAIKKSTDDKFSWFDILAFYPEGYENFYHLNIKRADLQEEGFCNVEEFVNVLNQVARLLSNESEAMTAKMHEGSEAKLTGASILEKIEWAQRYIAEALIQYTPSVEAHRRLEGEGTVDGS